MRNWEGFAIRCALTFWNPFFAVGLPQTVYAFNDVHVFSINHVQDCCRIDAYKSRHYLTSICCRWEFQVHPDKNWPFCLINPLAKWPEIFATFENRLISPISVSIKSFSAALTKSTDSRGVHAYKSEYYFTSLKYLFGNFKFPPRNWPFCLTHPLAKSPKLVIRASFRKLLISSITNVFIKPFSA